MGTVFSKWCASRGWHPWRATIQQIANYLLHLCNGGNHKVGTIGGYCTMIASSLKSRGLTVGSDPYLLGPIASFYMDRSVECNLVLRWDLSTVLNALTRLPFKSKDLVSVPLKFLLSRWFFSFLCPPGQEGRDTCS